MRRIALPRSGRQAVLGIAMVLFAIGACSGPSSTPVPAPQPEPALQAEPLPRSVMLEDGSYVELGPGVESGFAHCCGNDNYRMDIECSDGLVRCYENTGKRWKQTYGKHCKSSLDRLCYEQACARVCEAYWELGPTRWHEVTKPSSEMKQ